MRIYLKNGHSKYVYNKMPATTDTQLHLQYGPAKLTTAHWVNSRISRNNRTNRPKIGLFGPVYKIQTMIEKLVIPRDPLSYFCH